MFPYTITVVEIDASHWAAYWFLPYQGIQQSQTYSSVAALGSGLAAIYAAQIAAAAAGDVHN
jgi:hypothetical protein